MIYTASERKKGQEETTTLLEYIRNYRKERRKTVVRNNFVHYFIYIYMLQFRVEQHKKICPNAL